MPHLHRPRALLDDVARAAAVRELAALDPADAACAPRREALARVLEDDEARRAGYDLPRMRAALAPWSRS